MKSLTVVDSIYRMALLTNAGEMKMGEMADYIINGDDCQYCGEYLGEGDGYPRSCSGCSDDGAESENMEEIKDLIETGLSLLRTAAIDLRSLHKNKKSKGLHNMCDQISKFSETLK